MIDEFGRIPCGDFMARMDLVFAEFRNNSDSKIHVIYYGARYRKKSSNWNQQTKRFDKLKLEYAHRDDGLNWAKSIPLYLTTYPSYSVELRNLIKDKIVLIDGGYREKTEVEIWIVPKNAGAPKPAPTIESKNIKFREDRASRITDCTKAYEMYENPNF